MILNNGPACLEQDRPSPCTLVIFGASGDLTSRKLIPSLANLFRVGRLPDSFAIIGAARSEMNNESFRDVMRKALQDTGLLAGIAWKDFARRLFYYRLDYKQPDDYANLKASIESIEQDLNLPGNRMFYLAIPPGLYQPVARNLGAVGLANSPSDDVWCRIVVEKPFGRDLKSSQELDAALHEYFDENQIFRIDHYLAKETIQNLLLFRFANAIFEPVWNLHYIDYVSITAAERLGVEYRAGYYDESGVLRDMFQNHMMQLLAMATIEPPSKFQSDRVRDEKAKVYRSLRPFDLKNQFEDLVLGQYESGVVEGKRVVGYREESGVTHNSLTPTFAMLRAYIDNWRWQGVPFYITSGKRMPKKVTRIVVQFKQVPHSIFRDILGPDFIAANRLVMETYPNESIRMSFQVKQPDTRLCLRTSSMHFNFNEGVSGPILDAYEKVLIDSMIGDHMLFWRQDSVELCWEFLTPILEMCDECSELEKHIRFYPSGSWGPEETARIYSGYIDDVSR
ncbi:glucose-6-phosphate dehydrogenase [Desulfovibrio inopinatus]|uniref:glucose-6-phosphate dehydrogenase n=1 Tax=Desulfovibrio inopinatus TaxID=102109 RepID=UPI0003FFD123|nr:glucose-6-phosphate dehydrogenase [Desulfovibrio inopinatus]